MTSRLPQDAIRKFALSTVADAIEAYERFGQLPLTPCCAGQLFCDECATNVCFRMGAPWPFRRGCISVRARAFLCSRGDSSVYFWNPARAALAGPGCPEIDAVDGDVELVQRVATGKKPLATIVLIGKSQADAAVLDALLRSSGLPFWPCVNKHGVSMVALAADKRVADLVNVVTLLPFPHPSTTSPRSSTLVHTFSYKALCGGRDSTRSGLSGHYTNTAGQRACISCDSVGGKSSFYQESPNATACIECPENFQRYVGVLSAANRSSCMCRPGFFFPTSQTKEVCLPCPEGGIALGSSALRWR